MSRHLGIGVVCLFTLIGCAARQAVAQAAPRPAFAATENCLGCHSDPSKLTPEAKEFCPTVPATVWSRDDKHARAFKLLIDPKNVERVTRILGFPLADAFAKDKGYTQFSADADHAQARKVADVKLCLRCHATLPKDALAAGETQPPVLLDLGVSCQACHGPGLKYTLPHAESWWRLVEPSAKEALGFHDVRNPLKKAQLCVSCHVGSIEQEKFIRHEWYAGGHPPLPSFELAAFSAQMPRHWRALSEKGDFAGRDKIPNTFDTGVAKRAQYRQLNIDVPEDKVKESYIAANPTAPTTSLPRTGETIVSSVAVLQGYVGLLADYSSGYEADLKQKEGSAPRIWPEFSLYDCSACHHELRSSPTFAARPARRHVYGRPTAAVWTETLAPLGIAHANGFDKISSDQWRASFEKQLLGLDQALTEVPFGKPAALAAEAGKFRAGLNALADAMLKRPMDEAVTRQSLQFLSDPRNTNFNDFHSARQAAWAVTQLRLDLLKAPYYTDKPDDRQVSEQIDKLFLQNGQDVLGLQLPAGQQRSVVDNLSVWLPLPTKYDADWFVKQLRQAADEKSP